MTIDPADPSLSVIASAGSPPLSGTSAPVAVRLGFLALSDCAPLIVARALDLDLQHGIRLELRRENSWASLRDKLMQGELDGAHCLYGLALGVHLGIGGPRHPMHVLMTLSANGQAICLGRALHEQGISGGPALAAAVRAGRRFTFAHTYPTGTHAMWLHYWLASHGIDPLRDVRMITVPPMQMVSRLGDGSIDGCCVGEPWGAQAVALGVGVTAATSQQVWPDHPEKVLAAGAGFAEAHPERAIRLVATLLAACRELDVPGRRAELAARVADAVDVPLAILLPRFVGTYDDGIGRHWQDNHGLRFFADGAVNPPRLSDALWFLSQFRRWGLIDARSDAEAVAAAVQQTDLYAAAASRLGITVPPELASPVTLGDGRVWTGRDPEGYAASFVLRA